MFENTSGEEPQAGGDTSRRFAMPPSSGASAEEGKAPDDRSAPSAPVAATGRSAVELELRAQVPRRSTYDIVSSPLPEDCPNPAAVRLSHDDERPWVDELQAPPSPALLNELAEAFPSTLGDLDLMAALVAWERMNSWVAARHAEALAALAARTGRLGGIDQVAAILATEVGYTPRAAKDKLAWAHTLGTFPAVAEALEAGRVDVAKSRAICEEALTAPKESAQEVAALGLVLAPRKTPPQLRRALRAAVLGLDPDAAARRAEKARSTRRVEFLPLPDAMAMITAYLPATDAVAVKTALDALARTTGSEDARTFDQRRADYLGAIFHAICDAGEAPLHPSHSGASPLDPDSTGEDPPATSEGAALRAADFTLWRRLATNQRQRPHLQVTVATSTLLGLDDRPGELTGYGPIPADVARHIATDATWRALYTDRIGAVTAVGERTYRPGAVLARHVAARDRTCTFTGCSRPAVQCDIDHREPFTASRPASEQTHLDNLHALCRFHHNLKTLHGWTPEHDSLSGVTTWVSPLGTRHRRDPEPPLPPWESWLEELAQRDPGPACPCVTASPDRGRDGPDREAEPPPPF